MMTTLKIKRSIPKVLLLATIFTAPFAFAAPQPAIEFTPTAPTVKAAAYILIDYHSGKVLAEMNADTRRDPASLTKIMTSYVIGKEIAAGKITESDMVTVGRNAWATGNPIFKGSSLMFLKPGDRVSVSDLNKGIIIQSGNDACVAMAEYVAGSQETFVTLMNGYAQALGMDNTRFATVHGLDDPQQYTSARDIATLSRALIYETPQEYEVYKQKEYTFNNIRQTNRNGLLWDTSLNVDGIKTGHTSAAGYNLAASATDGDMRLISVVLGDVSNRSREEDSKQLLTWGFRFFTTVAPVKADKQFAAERVWYGQDNYASLGSSRDAYVTIPRNKADQLKVSYTLNSPELHAPIQKGQQVGTINYTIDGEIVGQAPLVALQAVEESGFFGKIIDYIKLTFHRWFS